MVGRERVLYGPLAVLCVCLVIPLFTCVRGVG